MKKIENKHWWLVGIIVAIISFVIFFSGVRFVLGNELILKNILAYMGFSALVGLIASLLGRFRLKIAFVTFILGLIIGFFIMYRSFIDGMSGWGGLVGVLSLGIWIVIGLGVGLLVQFGYYLYCKFRNK